MTDADAERELYMPTGLPPQRPLRQDLFARLGEAAIRRLLSLHYANLTDTALRDLFPADPTALEAAAQKSADFFIQVMGGPAYFSERYGPPRMRARHLPFEITKEARDLWLICFRQALDELPFPPDVRPDFEEFLDGFSLWMVNTRS